MSKDIQINGKEGHMHGDTGLYPDYDNKELNKKKHKIKIKQLNSKLSSFDNYILGESILRNIVIDKNKMIVSIKKSAIKSLCRIYKLKGILFLIHHIGLKGLCRVYFDRTNKYDHRSYKIKRTYKVIKKEVIKNPNDTLASYLLKDE